MMGFFRNLFCLGTKKENGAKAKRGTERGSHRTDKPLPSPQRYGHGSGNEKPVAHTHHVPRADGYINPSIQPPVEGAIHPNEPYQRRSVDHHNQQFPSGNSAGFAQHVDNNVHLDGAQSNFNMFLIPRGFPGSVWSELPAPFIPQSTMEQPQVHPEVHEQHQQQQHAIQFNRPHQQQPGQFYDGRDISQPTIEQQQVHPEVYEQHHQDVTQFNQHHNQQSGQFYDGRDAQAYADESYPTQMQYARRSSSPARPYSPIRRRPSESSDRYQVSADNQQPEGEFFGTLQPRAPDSEPPILTSRIMGMSIVPHFKGVYSDVHKGQLKNNSRGEPQYIAIKVLKLVGDLSVMRRKFRREQQIWWGLVHPNIIPLLGVADFSNFGSLISPWCLHGDVTKYLANNRLLVADRVQIWKGVARGMDYLHSHDPPVIHGDLKPANVLIDATGTPLVCDFGLSRAPPEDGKRGGNTTTSIYYGTIRYVPREVIDGYSRFYTAQPTKESDVHALGCIGFEVIYLTKPYAHRPVDNEGTSFYLGSDILLGIPPATRPPKTVNSTLWNWLEGCWNIDPSQRPEVRPLAIWLCFPEWIEQEEYEVPPAEYYKALRPQV